MDKSTIISNKTVTDSDEEEGSEKAWPSPSFKMELPDGHADLGARKSFSTRFRRISTAFNLKQPRMM